VSSVGQKLVLARPLSWSPRSVIRRYGAYCSLALLLLIALVVRPEVYRPKSLFLILRSASQLGMVALGQTLVMLVAGLDLSVSGVIVLTSVVIAQVGAGQDSKILPGVLLSLGLGESMLGRFNCLGAEVGNEGGEIGIMRSTTTTDDPLRPEEIAVWRDKDSAVTVQISGSESRLEVLGDNDMSDYRVR